MVEMRLIETDDFGFEFLSQLGEKESWRKEVHRPVYHTHKWWATRLGSIFRGILLGSVLTEQGDLASEFYRPQDFSSLSVFDPFMGSGTTVGEAHKLGFIALGRDINPVAVESVRVALGPLNQRAIEGALLDLSRGVGERILTLYRSTDRQGRPCDVLYYFWVMQAACPACSRDVDLFSSQVIARNAYPNRKPEVHVLCPACGDIFPSIHGQKSVACPSCGKEFPPELGVVKGASATCSHCSHTFAVRAAASVNGARPRFRLYGKLVLNAEGEKEYLPATAADQEAYEAASARLASEVAQGAIQLPTLTLEDGYNTRQAMGYGFRSWRDLFNDRQLLALGWLRQAIMAIEDQPTRAALLNLFSGTLEFNNLFASYKGEGTGAVRHMFSHHVLKPERTPIEANVWGTPKSSGSFTGLVRGRLLRAIQYRNAPTEVSLGGNTHTEKVVASPPFSGRVEPAWPEAGTPLLPRGIYLSAGNSMQTELPDQSVDLVVTDPPFFDNVHYSELADFFYAWQQLGHGSADLGDSTRNPGEVQDADVQSFATKLQLVFTECRRILRDSGLLVFTYHHSREEGWKAVAKAILGAGFAVVNAHPVRAEMSVATPKTQAKEPIQLDAILVCRKQAQRQGRPRLSVTDAIAAGRRKIERLNNAGFQLSRNDHRVVLYAQLLAALESPNDLAEVTPLVESELVKLGSVHSLQATPAAYAD